jgi:hypothetical protein
MWIPPEIKDPVLQHHPTRKSVGYFGAVRLRDGKFLFAREQNRFDAMTTWDFLRLLHGRSLKSRRRVVVITDNAKFWDQGCKAAGNQGGIAVHVLDAKSGEGWRGGFRSRGYGSSPESFAFHDEYFPSLGAVIEVVEAKFEWALGNETLRRLCSI